MQLVFEDVKMDGVIRKKKNIPFLLSCGNSSIQTEQRSCGTVLQDCCSTLFGTRFGGFESFGNWKNTTSQPL